MRIETKLFGYLAIPFIPVAMIYGFATHWREPVGVIGISLTAIMCAFVAFYLSMTGRKIEWRPEDDPDGEIAQAEGDYGTFSPYSWWPLWLAGSAALVMAGAAVGWWLATIGVVFGVWALVGWTFEYYRGEYAN